MISAVLAFLFLGLPFAVTTQVQSNVILSGTNAAATIASNNGVDFMPTEGVTYASYASTITIPSSAASSASTNASMSLFASDIGNNSETSASSTSTTRAPSILTGTLHMSSSSSRLNGTAASLNVTASSTSSAAHPTNTQPCNDYVEFCNRNYSNITYVAAHNSPFTLPNNAASNQALGVVQQLNDGIRMLQGQTQFVNNTLFYCHTSCDLLNAGTAVSYFANITGWLQAHPYEVVTLLIGNGAFVNVGNFTGPLESSGLSRYAYVPPLVPMAINDWPTLGEMILTNKRVVIFMDYQANQTQVPYILDEFSQIWETPFSPTDSAFPCVVQRPPGIDQTQAEDRMYMINHNLNVNISLAGLSLLVPNIEQLNVTNGITGQGSLGLSANNCLSTWPRPPNFLLVDYYNVGNGSVFQVAADLNNVTYTRQCCGLVISAASKMLSPNGGYFVLLLATMVAMGLVF